MTYGPVDPAHTVAPSFDHFVASNKYGSYCIPAHFRTREVPRLLRKGEVYEPATLGLMQRVAGSGDIVSGGAFVGDFFPALSRALVKDALLHSFEPNPDSHAAALHTIGLNALPNVCLSAVAVGESAAAMPLMIARKGANILAAGAHLVQDADDGVTVTVPVLPLDDLVPPDRQVSILHLDIEGHEGPALLGASRIVSHHNPIVIVEVDKRWRRNAYLDILKVHAPDADYQIATRMENNTVFVPQVRMSLFE